MSHRPAGRAGRWPLLAAACLCCASCADYDALARGRAEWAEPADRSFTAGAGARPATSPATSTSSQSSAPADRSALDPLRITVRGAVLLAMENNRQFVVERLSPPIRQTFEEQERAAFDPLLGLELSRDRVKAERLGAAGTHTERSTVDGAEARASFSKFFPSGTAVGLEAGATAADSSQADDRLMASRIGLTLTQAMLRGAGAEVNLVRLRQARLDTRLSEYELRGFAEALVAGVEQTYWDYVLAQRQIEIVEQSLELARQQLRETEERVRIGRLAETELAAAQAELALRQEGLINARSDLARTRLVLLRLLNPPGQGLWDRPVVIEDAPAPPRTDLGDPAGHVRTALRMRPDLNQARLLVQREDLEVVRTRNGLLPRMDLFLTLGRTGYADSFPASAQNVGGDTYDVLAGLRMEIPPLNRQARAEHRRATLSRRQAVEAVENLAQLVEVDVRSAYVEAVRAREQVAATASTRALQEEKLRAETEKFRVGKSTSLLVASAQRDLVSAQLSEIRSVVNLLKALVELHRLEGSLLELRGLDAPGRQPATLPP